MQKYDLFNLAFLKMRLKWIMMKACKAFSRIYGMKKKILKKNPWHLL